MGYNTNECKRRKCPHCKRIIYLKYVRGCWDELKSKITLSKMKGEKK